MAAEYWTRERRKAAIPIPMEYRGALPDPEGHQEGCGNMKNIVFDIGNVLADYRLKEFLAEKGFDPPMIRRLLRASVMSPYWAQFERGELTEGEALAGFVSLDPEIGAALEGAFSNIHGMLTLRDYAVDWVRALKAAGYRVYYFSNYSKKAFVECRDSLPFLEDMDGGVLSFQAGMTKPDPRFYRYFLERYPMDPRESVFLDDTPENVAVAEELGFHGILFRSYADAVSQLHALGVIASG